MQCQVRNRELIAHGNKHYRRTLLLDLAFDLDLPLDCEPTAAEHHSFKVLSFCT